jgi:phenylalanyl-tRNA synthetase alpha chain
VTRARRYTRYISSTVMLRSHTSAVLPTALEDYAEQVDVDELIVVPGLVYRRDAVDGRHVGEPHQVDLWRIRDTPDTDDSDMLTMIGRMRKLSQPSRSSVARRPGSVLTASPASSGS